MQTEQIIGPTAEFSSRNEIQSSHYQVQRRRKSSLVTDPYRIPVKNGANKVSLAGSAGKTLGSLAAVSADAKPEAAKSADDDTVGSVANGASVASVASPSRTGGPILTHHYPSVEEEEIRLRQQQYTAQQQHLQEQVASQMEMARDKIQSQHRGKAGESQQPIPMLSREFVVRRISEGESGRLKEELKCEACGKGYKHITSLAKHLWEHTPEWQRTKKLSISKHQQVQLLEAASILCSMNEKKGLIDDSNYSRSASYSSSPPLQGRKNSVSQYPPSSLPVMNSRAESISNITGSSLREIRAEDDQLKDATKADAIEDSSDEEGDSKDEDEIVGRME